MIKGLFRIWVISLLAWWGYNFVERRAQIFRPEPHDWEGAVNFGLNRYIYCEFPSHFNCETAAWFPGPEARLIEQDFNTLATMVLLPFLSAVVFMLLIWILKGFISRS